MKDNFFDVIIIGAGPAGLSASYFLTQHQLKHVVFERGKIGESWISQRWDSFRLNSPNRLNELPGSDYFKNEPGAFCSASDYVLSFRKYVDKFCLPVVEYATVHSVKKLPASEQFRVEVSRDKGIEIYHAKNVIVASGYQSEAKKPFFSKKVSSAIYQLHASGYKSPDELPPGNVLVVGSAQSGCQIAEDLADNGRKVYLSTSMVPRVPRQYRGRDIHDWLLDMKFFDVRKEQVQDPAMLNMKSPQLTGVGSPPKTMSLQSLAKKGVTIIGKLSDAKEHLLAFEPNVFQHIKFADAFSLKVKTMIDEFISKTQFNAPPTQLDEEDAAEETGKFATEINSLDLLQEGVSSIIWATGFSYKLDYIKFPVVDEEGNIKQRDGMSETNGLFFLGFSWLRSRKSVLLCGIREDAEFITREIREKSRAKAIEPV